MGAALVEHIYRRYMTITSLQVKAPALTCNTTRCEAPALLADAPCLTRVQTPVSGTCRTILWFFSSYMRRTTTIITNVRKRVDSRALLEVLYIQVVSPIAVNWYICSAELSQDDDWRCELKPGRIGRHVVA